MDSKVNYILVGFFVVLLGALLIGGVLWLSTGGFHGAYRQYVMYTSESVSGLNADAAVRYRGVKVGRVSNISLAPNDPGRVRLLLNIVAETPVKTDTVATLEMQGLTGLMDVNLIGGSKEAPPLAAPPGKTPVIPSKPSALGQINKQAEALAAKLNETINRLNRLLSDQNQSAISRSLEQVERITSTLAAEAGTVAATLQELRRTVHQARRAGEAFPSAVQSFKRTAESLERMADDMAAGSSQVRQFMGETLPTAGEMVEQLRETATNLRSASETLARDPSVLLYGRKAPAPGPGE